MQHFCHLLLLEEVLALIADGYIESHTWKTKMRGSDFLFVLK